MAGGFWVVLAAILVALIFDLVRRRRIPGIKLNLPPGPTGVPVLGNLLVFKGSKHPHIALADLSKRYGPLMFLSLGSTPCVVASSPEACRQIFKEQDRVLASRPRNSVGNCVMYEGKGMFMAPFGTHWRQMRKVTTAELLTHKRMSEFESSRVAEASAMVRVISQHETGKPVNLHLLLKALSFNIIATICLGRRYVQYRAAGSKDDAMDFIGEEAKEFAILARELSKLLGDTAVADVIPYLSFLDWLTGMNGRMMELRRKVDMFLEKMLQQKTKDTSISNDSRTSFIDVLVGLPGEDGAQHLDRATIKALCLEMLAAGLQSTSTSAEWIMAEVVRHPEVAVKVQAELDAVVGKKRVVTEADIANLPYLQALVKEGLRLHPALPLIPPHESMEQTKVLGYDIPKGTTILANVWGMHRDSAVWDKPMEFRPDRFLQECSGVDVQGQNYQLLPFGAGRRKCAGLSLGLIMVQYAVARLLQAFDWSLPQGMMKPEDLDTEDLDMKEAFGMTLDRAHALEAVATARLTSLLY